jgi:hypothetical protein
MIAAPSAPPASPTPPASLGEMLTSVARHATDARLTTMMISGLAGAAIVALVLGRRGWLGAAALLAIGAYGGWGIADRELNRLYSRPGASRGLVLSFRLLRALCAIVAGAASVSAAFQLLTPLLGRWIS